MKLYGSVSPKAINSAVQFTNTRARFFFFSTDELGSAFLSTLIKWSEYKFSHMIF